MIRNYRFGINAFNEGVKGDGVTDDTAAINNLIKKRLQYGGGRIEFPSGTYRTTSIINLWDTDVDSIFIKPLDLVGEGMNSAGSSAGVPAKGSTVFEMDSGHTNGCFYAKMNGRVGLTGLTFHSIGPVASMVKIMNSTTHIDKCAFFAQQDTIAIRMGGTLEFESHTEISDIGGFQGYGTVIEKNFFTGKLVAVYGTTFTNATVVRDNNVWLPAGRDSQAGGLDSAIIFDGLASVGVQHAAGGVISGNLIEVHGYKYGIRLGEAKKFSIMNNNMYDAGDGTLACVYFGADSEQNILLPGFSPNDGYGTTPEYIDESTAKTNRIIQGTLIS